MNAFAPSRAPFHRGGGAGFSIVELLVVLALLTVLAAIAVPRFTAAKESSHDATVKSDLRNAMNLEEQYYSDHGAHLPFSVAAGGREETLGFSASPQVSVTASLGEDGALVIVGSHSSGSSSWCLNNAVGRLVEGDSC